MRTIPFQNGTASTNTAITVWSSHSFGSSNKEPARSAPANPAREYTMENAVDSRKARSNRQPFLHIRSLCFCIFFCPEGLICIQKKSKNTTGHTAFGIIYCLAREYEFATRKIRQASIIYSIIYPIIRFILCTIY